MPTAQQQIEALHKAYCELTGREISLDMARERDWFEWQKRKFTIVDLALVIRAIRAGIRNGKRNPGALKFSNLITDVQRFEEDLAEVRSADAAATRARTSRPDPARASILRATGRDDGSSSLASRNSVKTSKEATDAALAGLRAFRESNK